MEVQSVGVASISYNEESQKLINLRNQGAMLSDPTIREGYVQGAIAEGLRSAGSNSNGAMAGFMGMGMGMQAGGGFMGAASAANMQQMQMNQGQMAGGAYPGGQGQMAGGAYPGGQGQAAGGSASGSGNGSPAQGQAGWTCGCGTVNTGKFCSECGSPRPAASWTCSCGTVNTGKFCSECGKPRG